MSSSLYLPYSYSTKSRLELGTLYVHVQSKPQSGILVWIKD